MTQSSSSSKPVVATAGVATSVAVSTDTIRPRYVHHSIVQAAIAVTLVASIYSGWGSRQLPDFAAWSSTLALVVSLCAALFVLPRAFFPGLLITLLPFVIAWRVAAMNSVGLMEWVAGLAFLPLLLAGADYAVRDWQAASQAGRGAIAMLTWQLTAVRMYFGLNELGHATEKIFAGEASFHNLVHGFQGFGLGHAAWLFVILGGLTELSSAISVGLGVFARLGAFVSIGYFLVATVGFGHEWTRGYAWATNGGGGWEYVMLVLVVFGSVLVGGAGKFSIDGWLVQRGRFPKKLEWLCGTSALPPR